MDTSDIQDTPGTSRAIIAMRSGVTTDTAILIATTIAMLIKLCLGCELK